MQVSRPDQSSVSSLLKSLKKSGVSESELQLTNLQKAQKVVNRQSKAKQQHQYRKANYEAVSSNMDKWVPIIKINREKEHLDFTQKSNNQVRVTFFPSNNQNPLTKRIEDKLKNIGVGSQSQLLKQEQKILQTLKPDEAKERMNEAIRRSTAFYQQIKRKRISKIKSKLYRKIKKRQKQKQQLAKFQTLGPEQREYQMQKLRNKRIQQRISLRHKIKSRHIQDMMRFGDKTAVQKEINDLNRIRREQLQKLNQQMLKDMSQEYDDQNFRQQALKDLQDEMGMLEQEDNNYEQVGLKFMDKANKAKIQKEKDEARKLKEALINEQDLELSQQEEENSDSEQIEKKPKKVKKDKNIINIEQNSLRKKYDKKSKSGAGTGTGQKVAKKTKSSMKQTLSEYINQKMMAQQNPQQHSQEEEGNTLIKGININNLKNKYQSKRMDKINMQQLIENNPDLFDNFDVLENRRQFEAQKNKEFESELPDKPKVVKGWDSWAGPGIIQPQIDHKKQLETKLKQIQQIKRRRKDGLNQDVIIRENRNKVFAREYLVSELPYNFKSKQQFDYLQQQPLGPEWNSLSNFQQIIKPRIKTKAGETIQPISLPKKIAKLQ